jgi:hypothetical protein
MEALPHLGAAVVHQDRSVGIDQHQRTGLVEVGRGEADAELDGGEREPLLQDAVRGIERVDGGATAVVAGAAGELGDKVGRDVVGDLHVVGCQVASGRVEVGATDGERVQAELRGDRVHHPLDRHHALRSAEAAKGGVRDGVGAEAAADDLDRREPVAIVGVEHRAVVDRRRQIDRGAAAGGEVEAKALDPPCAIEPDIVGHFEVVTLARHRHVVVAVEAELGGPSGPGGDERAGDRGGGGLGLLATEGSAHPTDLDRDVGVGEVQDLGGEVLYFARVLGGGQDVDLPLLAGGRKGYLPLEVEMLLSTDREGSGEAMLRSIECSMRVAACHPLRLFDGRSGGTRVGDRYECRLRDGGEHRLARGFARGIDAVGGDQEQRLARVEDRVGREERVVAGGRAHVVDAGDIGGGVDRDHAGVGADGGELEAGEPGVAVRRETEGEVEQAGRFGQVVDVERGAGDVLGGAVVRQRAIDRTAERVGVSHR